MTDEPKKKRAKRVSPTKRSLDWLRANGYTAQVVERWQSFFGRKKSGEGVSLVDGEQSKGGVRVDLFGGIDIVALKPWPHQACLGVQSTSDDNVAARRNKLLSLPDLRLWVECGNRLVIHGWAKKGGRGERKLWTLREVELKADDFHSTANTTEVPRT